jgi:hypothetical protein
MKTILAICIATMLCITLCYADDLTDMYQQQLTSLYQQLKVCLERCVKLSDRHDAILMSGASTGMKYNDYLKTQQALPYGEVRQLQNKIIETKITVTEKNNGKLPAWAKQIEESFKLSEREKLELGFALGK